MVDTFTVEFKSVEKVYPNGTRAVDNVSFAIRPGQIVALLGPSGCGKTTTLRLINRLEEATGGQILVRGRDIKQQRPEELRRSIGYVIQEGGLFPHISVSANVATVPKLLGWNRERIRERVREVLSLVGLPEEEFGKRRPSQLSGGQRQRVGVARGLAADPDILLMDDPFGALDPGTRTSIQDEFLRLQEDLHKTVIMVTHDITEAGKMADEIVLMSKGAVTQKGALREILLEPANQEVCEFLGAQGHGLALESLYLDGLLPKLEPREITDETIEISKRTTLGQTLVILAEVRSGTMLRVDDFADADGKGYDAIAVRDEILKDLRQAESAFKSDRASPDSSTPTTNTSNPSSPANTATQSEDS
ncbi:MAG: ABC transporter ATP-binding protein [Gemmataceae bacterium]